MISAQCSECQSEEIQLSPGKRFGPRSGLIILSDLSSLAQIYGISDGGGGGGGGGGVGVWGWGVKGPQPENSLDIVFVTVF